MRVHLDVIVLTQAWLDKDKPLTHISIYAIFNTVEIWNINEEWWCVSTTPAPDRVTLPRTATDF